MLQSCDRKERFLTEKAYEHWTRRFVTFHGLKKPRELGSDSVKDNLEYLANFDLGTDKGNVGSETTSPTYQYLLMQFS